MANMTYREETITYDSIAPIAMIFMSAVQSTPMSTASIITSNSIWILAKLVQHRFPFWYFFSTPLCANLQRGCCSTSTEHLRGKNIRIPCQRALSYRTSNAMATHDQTMTFLYSYNDTTQPLVSLHCVDKFILILIKKSSWLTYIRGVKRIKR